MARVPRSAPTIRTAAALVAAAVTPLVAPPLPALAASGPAAPAALAAQVPPLPGPLPFTAVGQLVAVDLSARSVTLFLGTLGHRVTARSATTVTVPPDARIIRGGVPARLAVLQPGDRVHVVAIRTGATCTARQLVAAPTR